MLAKDLKNGDIVNVNHLKKQLTVDDVRCGSSVVFIFFREDGYIGCFDHECVFELSD